ncbi:MAG TPA: energy transducer TonB [Candidatus Obscuribacterales bacterium]
MRHLLISALAAFSLCTIATRPSLAQAGDAFATVVGGAQPDPQQESYANHIAHELVQKWKAAGHPEWSPVIVHVQNRQSSVKTDNSVIRKVLESNTAPPGKPFDVVLTFNWTEPPPPSPPPAPGNADVDFGPYMSGLQRRIQKHWFPPKQLGHNGVVVVFKVHTGGKLSDLRLDRSSGVAAVDQAAFKTVEDAAPFAPMPKGAPDSVDFQFRFHGVGKPIYRVNIEQPDYVQFGGPELLPGNSSSRQL